MDSKSMFVFSCGLLYLGGVSCIVRDFFRKVPKGVGGGGGNEESEVYGGGGGGGGGANHQ